VLARALRVGVLARTLAPLPAAPDVGVLARTLAPLPAAPEAGDVAPCGDVAPRVTRLSVDGATTSVGVLAVAAGLADGERTRGDEADVVMPGLRPPRGVAARAAEWRGLPESIVRGFTTLGDSAGDACRVESDFPTD